MLSWNFRKQTKREKKIKGGAEKNFGVVKDTTEWSTSNGVSGRKLRSVAMKTEKKQSSHLIADERNVQRLVQGQR